jgi:hypothetical protein
MQPMRILLNLARLLFIMITSYYPNIEASSFQIILQDNEGVGEPLMRRNAVTKYHNNYDLSSLRWRKALTPALTDE